MKLLGILVLAGLISGALTACETYVKTTPDTADVGYSRTTTTRTYNTDVTTPAPPPVYGESSVTHTETTQSGY